MLTGPFWVPPKGLKGVLLDRLSFLSALADGAALVVAAPPVSAAGSVDAGLTEATAGIMTDAGAVVSVFATGATTSPEGGGESGGTTGFAMALCAHKCIGASAIKVSSASALNAPGP